MNPQRVNERKYSFENSRRSWGGVAIYLIKNSIEPPADFLFNACNSLQKTRDDGASSVLAASLPVERKIAPHSDVIA